MTFCVSSAELVLGNVFLLLFAPSVNGRVQGGVVNGTFTRSLYRNRTEEIDNSVGSVGRKVMTILCLCASR